MQSGDLDRLVIFERPAQVDDGHGGVMKGWEAYYKFWASFRFLRGGETVQAGRLRGQNTAVVTIENCAISDRITTEFRLRDVERTEIYNIRSILISDDRQWIELTCESGVAV